MDALKQAIAMFALLFFFAYLTMKVYVTLFVKKKPNEISKRDILSALWKGLAMILVVVLLVYAIILYVNVQYKAVLLLLTTIIGAGIATGLIGASIDLLLTKVMYTMMVKRKRKEL